MDHQELDRIREEARHVLTEQLKRETNLFRQAFLEALAGASSTPISETVSRTSMLAFLATLRQMTDLNTTRSHIREHPEAAKACLELAGIGGNEISCPACTEPIPTNTDANFLFLRLCDFAASLYYP
jgi:hypothetical protein